MGTVIEAVNRGVISPWWHCLQELISTYDIDPKCITKKVTWRQYVNSAIKAKTVEVRIKDVEEKSTLRYYRVRKEYDMEEYLSGNKRYKYECFAIRTGQAMLNNRCKWDRDIINVCPLCRQVGETEEHLILECESVKKERDIIFKMYGRERQRYKVVRENCDGKMHMILGLGEYVEVKDIKILETVGSM